MPGKKRVLVTGLSGVVGSAMRQQLEERYDLSSLSRYGAKGLPDDRNFKGNISDLDSILPAFEGQDTIVHLAADRSARAEWESALPNNLIGTYNVFEAARQTGVKRVVFGSSQHATGGFYRDPPYSHIMKGEYEKVKRPYPLLDETVRTRPSGYYGVSKAYGEALGSYYNDYHGLSSIHLRIGFTISTDDPTFSGGAMALWLSHRDTAQIHIRAIDAPDSLHYGVYYATSDNYWKVWSIDRAKNELGYQPEDGSGETFTPGPTPERDVTEFKVDHSKDE
ncbi:MAG: NAD(P)-dependent oxidoreductase [Dehalococcoidia bacterium]